MLIEDLERVEEENGDLRNFRDKFHAADKEVAVLKAKLTVQTKTELVSTGCIAVGAAALVYVPEAWKSQPSGWIFLGFGVVVTVVGIWAKAIKA